MSTTIEIWRSAAGVAPSDFSLLTTVPDGVPWSFLDTPVTPGHLYIYKARRYDSISATYSAFTPEAFVLGPSNNMNNLYTTANSGAITKAGWGIEAIASQPVKVASLLRFKSFAPGKAGPTSIELDEITGFAGVSGDVDGATEYKGLKVGVYVSPESIDGILAATFPLTTAAVAVPAAPAAPTVTPIGAAGAATRTYTIIARGPQGDSVASANGTTTNGNAALSSNNFDRVAWAGVPGATSYIVINAGNIVGQTQGLSFDVKSLAGAVYAAPSGPTGNMQSYKGGFGGLAITLAFLYGNDSSGTPILRVLTGCRGDKLSINWEKMAKSGLMLDWTFNALNDFWGFPSLASVGFDAATSDTLGVFTPAKGVVKIGGGIAGASQIGWEIDRNLASIDELTGYLASAGHYQNGGKHKGTCKATFRNQTEMMRFLNQSAASGIYSKADGKTYFPVETLVAQPVNGGGIVNQFGVLATYATYTASPDMAIQGRDGTLEMDIEFAPRIDPATGNDITVTNVNSLSNGAIVTPGTAITGIPANANNPYTS